MSRETSGSAALDETAAFIRRFVVFPDEHCHTAVTLWVAHTHAAERFYVTPRLVLDSAEPGSGKTRVLELLALLVAHPEQTISATVAAIFRMLATQNYTLLFDEVDAVFNPKNGGNYEDLRALLNAGYKKGATIARCVGDAKAMRVERFTVFAPVALAGLAGKMPNTITSRSVTIHMRKRAPGEVVEPFRGRDAEWIAEPIRTRLADWVDSVATALEFARPTMPDGVVDRPAEVWEALLAVADLAGGAWPDRARAACEHFVLRAAPGDLSFGVRLLADVRAVFLAEDTDRMASAALVEALVKLDESPYADLWGKPLDQRRLSKELARYNVQSKNLKMPDGSVRKGYSVTGEDGLADAWQRYLTHAATSATAATAQVSAGSAEIPVADTSATTPQPLPGLTSEVAPVALVAEESSVDRWRVAGTPIDPRGAAS